jgi:purine-binding chemotaxis protein CheW
MAVASERYAIPAETVVEVAEVGEISPVPGAPPAIAGVRNLRGTVLPVMDVAPLLGAAPDGPRRRLVVTEVRGARAGILVDDVSGIAALPPVSEAVEHPLVAGAVLVEGELVGILDVERILDAVSGGAA